MSGGAWTYNRFDLHEKKAKPDFLDMDKDGNKEEPMKKALKDKDEKKSKKDDCECKEEVEAIEEKASCDSKGKDKKKSNKKEYPKPNPVTGVYEGGQITKDNVLAYMMENELANNLVSAEVLFDHISDEFLEAIEDNIMEGYQPRPKDRMARQADRAYNKEQDAVRAGNEKETNKQMQRRIAIKSKM